MTQEFGRDLKACTQAIKFQVANIEQTIHIAKPVDVMQVEDVNLSIRRTTTIIGATKVSYPEIHPIVPTIETIWIFFIEFKHCSHASTRIFCHQWSDWCTKEEIVEEVLAHYMEVNNIKVSKVEADVSGIMCQMLNHEKLTMQIQTQLTQIVQQIGAMHKPDQFPSDTIVNSKDQCSAIHLRSGTQYQGPKMPAESNKDDAEKTQTATWTATFVRAP